MRVQACLILLQLYNNNNVTCVQACLLCACCLGSSMKCLYGCRHVCLCTYVVCIDLCQCECTCVQARLFISVALQNCLYGCRHACLCTYVVYIDLWQCDCTSVQVSLFVYWSSVYIDSDVSMCAGMSVCVLVICVHRQQCFYLCRHAYSCASFPTCCLCRSIAMLLGAWPPMERMTPSGFSRL